MHSFLFQSTYYVNKADSAWLHWGLHSIFILSICVAYLTLATWRHIFLFHFEALLYWSHYFSSKWQSWTSAPSITSALISLLLQSPRTKFVIVTLGCNGCVMLERSCLGQSPRKALCLQGFNSRILYGMLLSISTQCEYPVLIIHIAFNLYPYLKIYLD